MYQLRFITRDGIGNWSRERITPIHFIACTPCCRDLRLQGAKGRVKVRQVYTVALGEGEGRSETFVGLFLKNEGYLDSIEVCKLFLHLLGTGRYVEFRS